MVLEGEECQGSYLYGDDLKAMIENNVHKLDFVFMSKCHSDQAAKIFLDAGACHVIGVDTGA